MIFRIPVTDINPNVIDTNLTFCITQGLQVFLEMKGTTVSLLSINNNKIIKIIHFKNEKIANNYFEQLHIALNYNEKTHPELFL